MDGQNVNPCTGGRLVDIMSDKTTSERIADGVQAFKGMKPDPANLDKLLWYQTTFAPLLFEFSVEVGELYRQKNETEFQRRAAYNRAKFGYIGEGDSEWQIKEKIKNFLFEQGVQEQKNIVLVIDEGQKIPDDCLEILREFLNYETIS